MWSVYAIVPSNDDLISKCLIASSHRVFVMSTSPLIGWSQKLHILKYPNHVPNISLFINLQYISSWYDCSALFLTQYRKQKPTWSQMGLTHQIGEKLIKLSLAQSFILFLEKLMMRTKEMLRRLWMGFKLPVDLLSHSWPVASFSGCLSSCGSDLFFVYRLLAPFPPFLNDCPHLQDCAYLQCS